ncbi:hemerythrin domain-containing protein [Pseudooceanicola sp.]|uniref:hemerythrin domain-containing protein n=1 Tax=Pseudooceanicola sp. TaxID=1914328 RepID=UPI00405916A9
MRMPNHNIPERIGSAQHYEVLISKQEQICHRLELLADQLPDRIDTLAATMLADALYPTLRTCQDLEEAYVFPIILKWDRTLGPTVARLRAEHVEDEEHASVVAEAVTHFARSPRHADAERLGYLIRGLFQPLMRHSAFDRDIILPLYCRAGEPYS